MRGAESSHRRPASKARASPATPRRPLRLSPRCPDPHGTRCDFESDPGRYGPQTAAEPRRTGPRPTPAASGAPPKAAHEHFKPENRRSILALRAGCRASRRHPGPAVDARPRARPAPRSARTPPRAACSHGAHCDGPPPCYGCPTWTPGGSRMRPRPTAGLRRRRARQRAARACGLVEAPPPRASRPVGGGHRGAAAPPARAMHAAGPACARLVGTPPLRASRPVGGGLLRERRAWRGLHGRGWWKHRHCGPLGPLAGGVGEPPRLLQGRRARRGLRGRGWWRDAVAAGLSLPLAPYNKPVSPGGP